MVLFTKKEVEELLHQDDYTPRELASLLNTTEDYLNHEVWRGDLAASKIGHNIYKIKRSDVLDWFSRREQRT
jgi:excisionase family DNA binding protein